MKTIVRSSATHPLRILCVCMGALALCACSALQPTASAPSAFYALEYAPAVPLTVHSPAKDAPTLLISPVRAVSGFDSQRIIYTREDHKREYFAHNEWVDTAPRMLGPLLVAAIEHAGTFRAVVLAPASASGELRLDTEIVRLQQEFQTRPSRVHFTLRAYLIEEKTRRVLAWREFDETAEAASDGPHAGVIAANAVVKSVLDGLAQFLAQSLH
jgi:cholesterol transport system auxiliary component